LVVPIFVVPEKANEEGGAGEDDEGDEDDDGAAHEAIASATTMGTPFTRATLPCLRARNPPVLPGRFRNERATKKAGC
jgi:hypothetical protein